MLHRLSQARVRHVGNLSRVLRILSGQVVNSGPSYNVLVAVCWYHSFSTSTGGSFDCFNQFGPFRPEGPGSLSRLNPSERGRLVVALPKVVKRYPVDALIGFSGSFDPHLLVEIMKMLETRDVALAFFKLVFREDSDDSVRSCCIAAHLLAADRLCYWAQDLVSWVIGSIGSDRSRGLVEFMWDNHCAYESHFSVLNSIMRGFLKADMGYEALGIEHWMRQIGLIPSITAISMLLKWLLRVGDYGTVWKLFRCMVCAGPHPSNRTFNIMILGFCRKGYVRTGESLLHVMRKFYCEPDVYAYNIIINACCIGGWTSVALGWVNKMIQSGCEPSIVTLSTVVNGFCQEGNVAEARKHFELIQEDRFVPNVVIYNALINGYVKARDIGHANMLYKDMRRKGVAPDGATINILVQGNYRYGEKEDGDKILRECLTSELVDYSSIWDIVIAGLCWAGELDKAFESLVHMLEKGIPLSLIAFNSVIAAYSKAGLEEKAYETYEILIKLGMFPSASTCSSLLMGLSRKWWRLQEARGLMYKMLERGFQVNKVAFTDLLDGYFRVGDVDGARGLWKEMEDRGMHPDIVAFSAFINGLCLTGLVEEACGVFSKMSRRGYVPNNFSYNSLIQGFFKCGKLDEALNLEKEMRSKGPHPDVLTTNIIINGLCKAGRMQSATDVFMDMSDIDPDIVTYNTLIHGCYNVIRKSEVAKKIYRSEWNPDITTYNIHINRFCSTKKMSQAARLLNELELRGLVPNTVTYNILINGICADILDHSLVLAAKLIKMAFIPNVITINILLSQFCKQGMPEKSKLWGQKLRDNSFELDEVSYWIMDKASNRMQQDDAKLPRATPEKAMFLEFLMYITCDYLNRYSRNTRQDLPDAEGGSYSLRYGNQDL